MPILPDGSATFSHRIDVPASSEEQWRPRLELEEMQVQQILHDEVGRTMEELDALVEGDVAEFNALLRARGVPAIGVGGGG